LHYDEKYTREEINPWQIEKDGKLLEPLMKASTHKDWLSTSPVMRRGHLYLNGLRKVPATMRDSPAKEPGNILYCS
jgi:hypothetical protein